MINTFPLLIKFLTLLFTLTRHRSTLKNTAKPCISSGLFLFLLVTLMLQFPSGARGENFVNIGVPAVAQDGLTVTVDSITFSEKIGSYEYRISYTLTNDTNDQVIDEGSFKMFYAYESGGLPQYGFFGSLFPGDTRNRTHTFETLKNKSFDVLEYGDNFFSSEPNENSLHWMIDVVNPPPPNQLPTANAGTDQSVNEGESVMLNGSASSDQDGTISTYAWSQTGGTASIDLTGDNTSTPTFTFIAPDVSAEGDILTFKLTVTDNDGLTSTDNISITVGYIEPDQRSPIEFFITRFYRLCLDRDPDAAGLEGWTNDLENQIQTGADVAEGFINSQEFINKNTTDEEYLQILYQAFFDRGPDQGGRNAWLAELMNGGTDRGDVLDGFIYSQEFSNLCANYGILAYQSTRGPREMIEDFVTRFYELCLDRSPDPAGLAGWADNLQNQIQTGADVAEGFIFSPEFMNKYTADEEYLTILYQAFFNRNADQGGWDAWMHELDSGMERGQVLNGFIYSQEFSGLCDNFGIKAYDTVPPLPPPQPANFDGNWSGQAKSATKYGSDGDLCGSASVSMAISNFQISGTAETHGENTTRLMAL